MTTTPPQRIVRERRQYNQWVASQTLEDYALRYTADRARRTSFRVGNTALGPIAFLACEAIGGAITIAYGFPNAAWAILAFSVLMFAIGLPIAYYAARYGVDLDLLTRGAGFGYMGSTITSLIYASFTFLLFAIEASIMSMALQMVFSIPLWIGHLISALVVIPIAIYGISVISKMQLATQPIWLILQFLPLAVIAWANPTNIDGWTAFAGKQGNPDGTINWMLFAMAASILLSLLPQIGEQVDYLRFLPNKRRHNRVGWWTAVLTTGPGWVLLGGFKLFAGSFLAYLLIERGIPIEQADEPTEMYLLAFRETVQSPTFALVLTGIFVVVCQIKINVTNAYAGSIAWSNFFSRLTHTHPGRVVWLVFNVLLALLLMEMGIFRAIESILVIYANFAAGWIGALTADLVVNKPLGLSPKGIEFKRAHLYDINPVGVGALIASIVLSSLALLGVFGRWDEVLSPFVALVVAFITAPLIAWATRGRYYLARKPEPAGPGSTEIQCTICENSFDSRDVALCPAYSGPICSLCCTLEARCRDMCKTNSRFTDQLRSFLNAILPPRAAAALNTRAGQFAGLMIVFNVAIGLLLMLVHHHFARAEHSEVIATALWVVFWSLFVLCGVAAWLIVLAHESRRAAENESARQTTMLMDEIEAHKRTDAALQKAKEVAEAANTAKTRYIVGVSHEIRTPLNSIFGYAQLLERGMVGTPENAIRVIRRSAEHMGNLIDGLLDISKIENGLLKLNRDRVQLVEFLDQIVDMFRLQAAAKGIEFSYSRPQHLPTYVHTDQKRLRQILINLLSNAIKYTERGHASLVVRYRSQVAEFEVSDTGIGIPPEELERVFEPFERGRAPNVRSIPGTGLGLTITKLLTQIMGGEILAQSTPGVGTTFTVRLLLSEVAHPKPASAVPRRVTGYRGQPLKVLLIDDDTNHLDIVQNLLRPIGFIVFTARSGRAGLEMAAECRPHLAMVDLSMPDMTGWETAQKLREQCPGIRIAIVSANAHEYAPGSEDASHDAFIIKPIELQHLLDCIASKFGLEWIYETPPEPTVGEPIGILPNHSRHHLDDLYRLGRIGHVRGIQAKLQEIEAEDPSNTPFAKHLRQLVANFDLKRYMNVLEAMRRNG
jgi:signal transduction histidine kinase/CheY-like chemotaxis protein/purine-cytosine permease-like protein